MNELVKKEELTILINKLQAEKEKTRKNDETEEINDISSKIGRKIEVFLQDTKFSLDKYKDDIDKKILNYEEKEIEID